MTKYRIVEVSNHMYVGEKWTADGWGACTINRLTPERVEDNIKEIIADQKAKDEYEARKAAGKHIIKEREV